MTIEEAKRHEQSGRRVVYTPPDGGPRQIGVISSVGDRFVFVRYGGSYTEAATPPERLEWETCDS